MDETIATQSFTFRDAESFSSLNHHAQVGGHLCYGVVLCVGEIPNSDVCLITIVAIVVVPFAQEEKEALVFLHGYNCPLDYGLMRLAQLLALGNFPTHIHPFVFSWPTGGTLAYFSGTQYRLANLL